MKTALIHYSSSDSPNNPNFNPLKDIRGWWVATPQRPCFWNELMLICIPRDVEIINENSPVDCDGKLWISIEQRTMIGRSIKFVLFLQESNVFHGVHVYGTIDFQLCYEILSKKSLHTARVTYRHLTSLLKGDTPQELPKMTAEKQLVVLCSLSLLDIGKQSVPAASDMDEDETVGDSIVWPNAEELEMFTRLLTFADLANFENSDRLLLEKLQELQVSFTSTPSHSDDNFFDHIIKSGIIFFSAFVASQTLVSENWKLVNLFFNGVQRLAEVIFAEIIQYGETDIVETLHYSTLVNEGEITIIPNPHNNMPFILGSTAERLFEQFIEYRKIEIQWPKPIFETSYKARSSVGAEPQRLQYSFVLPYAYAHWCVKEEALHVTRFHKRAVVIVSDYRQLTDIFVYRTMELCQRLLDEWRVAFCSVESHLEYEPMKFIRYHIEMYGAPTYHVVEKHLTQNSTVSNGVVSGGGGMKRKNANGVIIEYQREATRFPSDQELESGDLLLHFCSVYWPQCMTALCRKSLVDKIHWVYEERAKMIAFIFTIGWTEEQAMRFWYSVFRHTGDLRNEIRFHNLASFRECEYGRYIHSRYRAFNENGSKATCSCRTLQSGGLCPLNTSSFSTDTKGVVGVADIEDMKTPGRRCLLDLAARLERVEENPTSEVRHPSIFVRRSTTLMNKT